MDSTTRTRRPAIYVRQSEDVAQGVDRQLALCRALVERKGWTDAAEYTDNDVSASKTRGDGTAWARLLADLDAGRVDTVVAVDLDRLLRSVADLVQLTDRGAAVVTVNGEIDLTTADGEFRATMLAGIARFEVRRKAERQRRANEDRATRGVPNPGKRRYGYETDGVTPREPEAVIVARAFQHVADGGSLYALVKALKSENVPTGTFKEWRAVRLRDMLLNPHYSGRMKYQGKVTDSDVIVPIVSRELADDVAAILSDPTRRTSRGTTPKHLLSGLVFCGVCGSRMFAMRGYVCRTDSRHPQIKAQFIEPSVKAHVADAILSGVRAEPASASPVAALVASHERIERATLAVVSDRDEGLVSPAVARTRLLELKTEREAVERALVTARAERSAAASLADAARELLPDADSMSMADYADVRRAVIERFDTLPLDSRREIVRGLLHVEVGKGRGPGRVRVEHLVAVELNDDAVEDYDAV